MKKKIAMLLVAGMVAINSTGCVKIAVDGDNEAPSATESTSSVVSEDTTKTGLTLDSSTINMVTRAVETRGSNDKFRLSIIADLDGDVLYVIQVYYLKSTFVGAAVQSEIQITMDDLANDVADVYAAAFPQVRIVSGYIINNGDGTEMYNTTDEGRLIIRN